MLITKIGKSTLNIWVNHHIS